MGIPNSQVVGQRIQNLSRAETCQVKQTLWFKYDDIDKMEAIVKAIKDEIQTSCPKLITDGSRPFRVHFSDFKDDHFEVAVDVNFNFSPAKGDEYLDNRQVVLQAIARAVEKNGVEFALPNRLNKNLDITPTATNN
jgi:small-conductance mechanosensitive channel